MGYKNDKNKGLITTAASLDQEVGAQLWRHPLDNIATRFGTDFLRSFAMDIPRGLAGMGSAVATDVAEVVREPLGMAFRAMGMDQEARGLGPEGWWASKDPLTGEPTGRRFNTFEDALKPIGQSFLNTGRLASDLVNPVQWASSAVDPEAREAHFERLGEQGRNFVERPFATSLEHVGNVAIGGSLAGTAGKLGIAKGSGAITGAQAARGFRPLAGRGVRQTATQATKEAAEAGSRTANATLFASDIVGHPYRALWRNLNKTRPLQLFRDPIDKVVGRERARATFGSQRGSFDFREGDIRRDWNELEQDFLYEPNRPELKVRQEELERQLVSKGIEPLIDDRGRPRKFDPNEVALTEPSAVITKEDFTWEAGDSDFPIEPGGSFTREIVEGVREQVEILGGDLTPDSIQSIELAFGTRAAYYVDKGGHVSAAVKVNPFSGINIGAYPSVRGGMGPRLLKALGEKFPDTDWQSALKNTTTSEFGTRLQEKMRQGLESGEVQIDPAAQGTSTYFGRTIPAEEPAFVTRAENQVRGSFERAPDTLPYSLRTAPVGEQLAWIENQVDVTAPSPLSDIYDHLVSIENYHGSDHVLSANQLSDIIPEAQGSRTPLEELNEEMWRGTSEIPPESMYADPRNIPTSTPENIRLRDVFGGEEGSIANPLAPKGPRDPMRMGPLDLAGNEAGILKNQFFESEMGQRFSAPARAGRKILRDRDNAARSGEGPLAERAFDNASGLRARGVRGVNQALDARTTEAKVLRGLRNLHRRPEGREYGDLLSQIDIGDEGGLRGTLSAARDVASGRRTIGGNLPADKLVFNVYQVIEAARKKAGTAEAMADEVGRIVPGVDAESLTLLALDGIEKARGLPEGSMGKALGDYIQGDTYLMDSNRNAQALIRSAGEDPTPARFRIADEHLDVDINSMPEMYKEIFYEAARQRRITQRFMEEAKAQAPDRLFNDRSGTRIGLAWDEPTQFGVNETYLNEVLGVFDQSLDDFGGNADAAMDALDDLQGEFFDVDVHTIRQGNATPAQKKRIKRTQKEFEKRQAERTTLLEEIDKIQSKDRWTQKDWDRHADLKAQSKKNMNQVITSAARLGKLRETVAGSLEAAPVSARNLMLYAREVVPEQIKALEGMLKDNVGDPRVINEMINELREVPRTLDDLNETGTYISYLKDVRDIPHRTIGGRSQSATRGPALRRRGTGTDATYVQDIRSRLFAQDMEVQRYHLARGVQEVVAEKGLSKTGASLLETDEFGFSPDDIANMTPGKIVDELSHAGYKVFTPDNLFELRRAPDGNPLEAQWIRSDVGEIITKGIKPDSWLESALQATYDKVLDGWKVLALPLRPAWQVNNVFGNALFTMLVGQVNPFDYAQLLRTSKEVVGMWNEGLARTVRIPLTKRWITELNDALPSLDSGQQAIVQQMLDDGHLILDNSIMNDIASNGLIRGDFAFLNNSQFFKTLQPHQQGILRRTGLRQSHPRMPKNLTELGDVGVVERTSQRARNLRATGREIVDYSYHINETMDNMHRTIVYLDQMRKGANHAEAISMTNKALGDYNRLSNFERRVVRRVYPFWPWMRHVLEVTGRLLQPDNIGRSLIFSHITSVLGEPNALEELLPDYARGDIFIGYGEEGTPQFFSVRGANPFLDVFDPLTQPNMHGIVRPMSPLITMVEEQRTGISNLTGRPFSSPIRRADQQIPRPPITEQITRQIPQLTAGRNIYRDMTGKPLARYGTGEAAIFPNAEADRSAMNNLTQLFGANIRPMDVENMAQREKLRLFQEAQDKARQEAKERAYEKRNSRSLSDLFR